MSNKPLNRDRVDSITRYLAANRDRLHNAVRALMHDDDGDPLPFVLLLPAGNGTHTCANIPLDTVEALIRACADEMRSDIMRKAFENVLRDTMTRIVESAQLGVSDDNTPADDDANKTVN